nr:MAG TPA: hypothetical protein [Inoviridae sp.]
MNMKVEITPEESRVMCNLLEANRALKVQSLIKFSAPDKRCILSERTIEELDKHILFIKSEISKIDNLISKLMEVQA